MGGTCSWREGCPATVLDVVREHVERLLVNYDNPETDVFSGLLNLKQRIFPALNLEDIHYACKLESKQKFLTSHDSKL